MLSNKMNFLVVILFVGRSSAAPLGSSSDPTSIQNGLDVLVGLLGGADSQPNGSVNNANAPTMSATSVAPQSYGPPPPPPIPPVQCKDKTIQSTDTNPFPRPPPPPPPPVPAPCKDKNGVVLPIVYPPPHPPVVPAYGTIPVPKVSGTSTMMNSDSSTSSSTVSSATVSSDTLDSVLGSASTNSNSGGSSIDGMINSSSTLGSLEAALSQNSVQMPASKPSAVASGSSRTVASLVLTCSIALLTFLAI